MQLNEIIDWIDHAFEAGSGAADRPEAAPEREELGRILGAEGFQRYLRDQVNRQIIRDYLTNAVVLGVIGEDGLTAFAAHIATEEGRSTLALFMLMSAVEEAADLPPAGGEIESLKPLQPETDRSHIKLVPP